jgi:hypothetical protein
MVRIRVRTGPELTPEWATIVNTTTVPRESHAGAFNFNRAGFLRIGTNNLIPKGMGVVPPPIVYLIAGL